MGASPFLIFYGLMADRPAGIRPTALDVVEGQMECPMCVYDLKTGSATLTTSRIQQIQSHIPGGTNVPVLEVRP